MPTPRVEIRFAATHEGFAQAFARLRGALDEERLDPTARYNVELVFEEIVANIVLHGATDAREPDVCVTLEGQADSILLTFEDDGLPFDPCGRLDGQPTKWVDEAKVGGFGLILVRRAASALVYVRTAAGRNRLSVSVLRAGPA
jgi:serine/threonine-protein kinase RsbW